MSRYIRHLSICTLTALFVLSGYITPELWQENTVKSLASVFALTSLLLLAFFRQFNSDQHAGVLTTREMSRYVERKSVIRKRFWYAFVMTTMSSSAIWMGSTYADSLACIPYYRAAIGFFFGLNISYAMAIASWLNELGEFRDKLQAREKRLSEQESLRKRLKEAQDTSK